MMAADPVLSPSSTVISEDDFFCPDCAQRQWSRASDDRARPGHASYWQWALVAVGVFLIVGNALQFASAAGRLITSETVVSSVPRLG